MMMMMTSERGRGRRNISRPQAANTRPVTVGITPILLIVVLVQIIVLVLIIILIIVVTIVIVIVIVITNNVVLIQCHIEW